MTPEAWEKLCKDIIHDAQVVIEIAQNATYLKSSRLAEDQIKFGGQLRGMTLSLKELADYLP